MLKYNKIPIEGNCFRHYILITLLLQSIAAVVSLCDDPDSWDCDNGACIDREQLCDGKVHCQDKSDESVLNCIGVDCPSYAFHCAYGGCVAGSAKCNGIDDCRDGSDETPWLCGTAQQQTNLKNRLHGNCSESSYQCKSGVCIDNDLMCDGRLDCDDGTDESSELCSATPCPPYSFKCGYGACVRGDAPCDGIVDCADSSDEAWSICKTERKRPPRPPSKPPTTAGDRCVILDDRSNLLGEDLTTRQTIIAGGSVPFNTYVAFSCKSGYTLIGNELNVCLKNGWKFDLQSCSKKCQTEEIRGFSTKAICYNEYAVNCNSTLLPGTQVSLFCEQRYREPKQFKKLISCSANGKWDAPRVPCQIECGRVLTQTTTFAAHASTVDTVEVPWHVGIYTRINERDFNYTCGGTIISPTIVLSAAHCFWDYANNEQYPKSLYTVVAGKYYSDYHKNKGNEHRSREILDIFIYDYKHRSDYYMNDLAVVILTQYLRFTDSIAPICLDFDTNTEQEKIDSNIAGQFAGWGFTEDRVASEELRRATIPSFSHAECAQYLRSRDENYILAKSNYCLRSQDGVSACRGDSGGGFVVERRDKNNHPYFRLIGVISHSPIKDENCAIDGVAVVTQVTKLKNFIMRYMRQEFLKE